jgi:cyanophycinase-like exopeptidase
VKSYWQEEILERQAQHAAANAATSITISRSGSTDAFMVGEMGETISSMLENFKFV